MKKCLSTIVIFIWANSIYLGAQITHKQAKGCIESAAKIYLANSFHKLDSTLVSCVQNSINLLLKDSINNYYLLGQAFIIKANQHYLRSEFRQVESTLEKGIDVLSHLDTQEADTLKGNLYNYANILHSEAYIDYDQAIVNNDLAIKYYSQANCNRGLAEAYINGASTHIRFGNCDLANDLLTEGKKCVNELDLFSVIQLAPATEFIKGNYQLCEAVQSMYSGIFDRHQAQVDSAIKTFKGITNTLLMTGRINELYEVYSSLGLAYQSKFPVKISNLDTAIIYFEKAAALVTERSAAQNPALNFSKLIKEAMQLPAAEAFKKIKTEEKKSLGDLDLGYDPKEIIKNPLRSNLVRLEMLSVKAGLMLILYHKSNDLTYLYELLRDAEILADCLHHLKFGYASEQSLEALGQIFTLFYTLGATASYTIYSETEDLSTLERGFQLIEKSKSYVLRQAVHEKSKQFSYTGPKKQIGDKIEEGKQRIKELDIKHASAKTTTEKSNRALALQQAKLEFWSFVESLKDGSPIEQSYYYERFDNTIPTFTEIQEKLPANKAIVEYSMGGDKSIVFLIMKDKIISDTLPRVHKIYKLVDEVEFNMSTEGINYYSKAYQLYRTILKPVLDKVPETITELIIIPDHKLWQISFEGLPTAPDNYQKSYLINRYTISYAFSVSMSRYFKRERKLEDGKLGIFLNDYTSTSDYKASNICLSGLTDLGSMNSVASKAGEAWSTAEVISSTAKETFINQFDNYNSLFLVNHGCANSSLPSPLDYSLVFTEQEGSTDESNLTAREIYSLNMSQIDWVFLGACNSAWGTIKHGEGLQNIARAFFYAGCSNLVASRTKAAVKPSAKLIEMLLLELQSGKSLLESLTIAKRSMAADSYAPKDWANWVYLGNSFFSN